MMHFSAVAGLNKCSVNRVDTLFTKKTEAQLRPLSAVTSLMQLKFGSYNVADFAAEQRHQAF